MFQTTCPEVHPLQPSPGIMYWYCRHLHCKQTGNMHFPRQSVLEKAHAVSALSKRCARSMMLLRQMCKSLLRQKGACLRLQRAAIGRLIRDHQGYAIGNLRRQNPAECMTELGDGPAESAMSDLVFVLVDQVQTEAQAWDGTNANSWMQNAEGIAMHGFLMAIRLSTLQHGVGMHLSLHVRFHRPNQSHPPARATTTDGCHCSPLQQRLAIVMAKYGVPCRQALRHRLDLEWNLCCEC